MLPREWKEKDLGGIRTHTLLIMMILGFTATTAVLYQNFPAILWVACLCLYVRQWNRSYRLQTECHDRCSSAIYQKKEIVNPKRGPFIKKWLIKNQSYWWLLMTNTSVICNLLTSHWQKYTLVVKASSYFAPLKVSLNLSLTGFFSQNEFPVKQWLRRRSHKSTFLILRLGTKNNNLLQPHWLQHRQVQTRVFVLNQD